MNKNICTSGTLCKKIDQPDMTWAVSKSLLIAADGTKVKSAAL